MPPARPPTAPAVSGRGPASGRLRRRLRLALLLGWLGAALLPAATEFHVAPHGDDAAPGSSARPFATVARAQTAIRELKLTAGLPAGGVVVRIAPGTYALAAPLRFTPEDSGTAAAPIVYDGGDHLAGDAAAPVLSGGTAIEGWRELEPGLWAADLPAVRAGRWYFEQLWINGRRATRARSPNAGYHYVDLKAGYGPPRADGTVDDTVARSFHALHAADLAGYAALTGPALHDVTLTVLSHNWIATRLRVAAVEPATRRVTLTGAPGRSVHSEFERGLRYHAENFRAALDAPGEWFLDRAGTLLYRPLPGETLAALRAVAPRLDRWLAFAGDGAAGRSVEHLAFRGLAFRHAEAATPPVGQPEAQAGADLPAALLADTARHLRFERCEFSRTGAWAAHFRHGCREIAVASCWFHDLGAGAVQLGGGTPDRIPPPAEHSSHFEFTDNLLRAGGRVYPAAAAILSRHCSDSLVAHNDIADFYYTGISLGWTWHYVPAAAHRNTVARNRLAHLGQGVLSDLAGIYTLGESTGTAIVGNVIHDVRAFRYGGNGLYSDQATSGVRIADNLVYRTDSAGYTMNFGRDVTVENNIFAYAAAPALHKGIGREPSGLRFARNLVWLDHGDTLDGGWHTTSHRFERNLYARADGTPLAFAGRTFAQWQALGHDRGSVEADPRFVDPAAGDFRLRERSPARALGFVPFDPAEAGVRGPAAWRALAARPPDLAPRPAAPAPPLTPLQLDEDFETAPLDRPPALARVEPTWAWPAYGLRVSVVADPLSTANRCLRLEETQPGLEPWAPMVVYSPAHREGVSRLGFDVKPGPAAHLSVSLEDRSGREFGVRFGPHLGIRDGKLLLLGHAPIDLPVDAWSRLTVTVAVGRGADGTFDVTLARADGTERTVRRVPYRTRGWNHLHWLAFSSAGEGPAAISLDNLRLENLPAP